jgi:hypothetical protein
MSSDKIKVGDRLRDNDKRMIGRELEVVEVRQERVRCKNAKNKNKPSVWISIDRIHADGKPRKYGFNLVANDGVVEL